jgi:ATPase subunit of ABC transporter with duplicated ATPase domains
VGANGSGKSTLMRILAGEEPPSDGSVSIPKRLQLGVLRQDHFIFEEMPILEVVLQGNQELWQAMVEKEEILARAEESFDGERYAELEDIILKHDGYSIESQAAEILEGLGIPAEVHREPLSTLSGGFKLRVLLAQVLAAAPDALLLDEPTNHLDILSIRWLEKFLLDFPGIVVVISHDHRFLDNVCSQILDVDYETVTLYPRQLHPVRRGQGPRARADGQGAREAREGDRPPQSFCRALPGQGHQSATSPEQAASDREEGQRDRRRTRVVTALSHFSAWTETPHRQAGAGPRGDLQGLW